MVYRDAGESLVAGFIQPVAAGCLKPVREITQQSLHYIAALVHLSVAIPCYILGSSVAFYSVCYNDYHFALLFAFVIGLTVVVCVFVIIFRFEKDYAFQLGATSIGLGLLAGIGILLNGSIPLLGPYLCLLSGFHFSEYLVVAIVDPKTLTYDSFFINNKIVLRSVVCGCSEFAATLWFFPVYNELYTVSLIGIAFCLCGEIIRKMAVIISWSNVTPSIKLETTANLRWKRLWCFGWYLWTVGSQVVLCNPLCSLLFTFSRDKFFE